MERSRIALASAVDALASSGRVTITESRTELALYQLDGAGAREVVAKLEAAGFELSRLADEGGDLRPEDLDDSSNGIELLAAKPIVPNGVFPILTSAGFHSILDRLPTEPVVWVQNLDRAITTIAACYLPWGDECVFVPDAAAPEPSRVVRFLGAGQPPEPIGRWILRDTEQDVSGQFLARWRARSLEALSRALTQEIEPDNQLLFRGPPPTRFRSEGVERVEPSSFAALQRATAWVYENPRELENRHALLAAEIARTALRDGDIGDLALVMAVALEGAKIAYEFGVSQQSRDALKSLGDLRKTVSDETTKLADATRSLAAALMTSTVGNVSLIIARLTIAKSTNFVGAAAAIVGIALTIYVGSVIISGWHFLDIQRDIRCGWRERLYRFLSNDEYKRMVTDPVQKAERGFRNAAWAAVAVSLLMLIAVILVVQLAPSSRAVTLGQSPLQELLPCPNSPDLLYIRNGKSSVASRSGGSQLNGRCFCLPSRMPGVSCYDDDAGGFVSDGRLGAPQRIRAIIFSAQTNVDHPSVD